MPDKEKGIRIGFTGTQEGMSAEQRIQLRQLLKEGVSEFHHGDCLGADLEADFIARQHGAKIVIHPPDNPSKRAFTAESGDTVWQPLPYLERNRDIVDSTDELIAAPKTDQEELRSGTWSTVRYARKVGKKVTILARNSLPDKTGEESGE